jgi:trehalose 6-phosphate synthase
MSREERVARWQAMSKVLWNSDVSRWAAAFIKGLAASKARKGSSNMAVPTKESNKH